MISLQERVHSAPKPESWKLNKLHRVFRVRRGEKNLGMKEDNLLSLSYGRIIQKNIETSEGLLPENFEGYQIVEDGNIVLRLTDLQNDKRSLRQGLVTQRGIITSAYDAVEVGDGHDPRFWFYSLLALDLAKHYYSLGGGVRQSVKFSDFPNDWVYHPDFPTQRAIANFLDRETARIDTLIGRKQRFVEVLDEKRGSMISETITSFARSGNRRIRDIAQVLTSNVDKVVDPDENPIRLCNYVDVYKNNFIHADMPFSLGSASNAEIKKFRVLVDDVIITKDSESAEDIGVPALVKSTSDDLVCAYHLSILRTDTRKAIGPYVYWHLLSKKSREDFANAANGVTRFGLTLSGIKNIPIFLPDLSTQRAIVDFLGNRTWHLEEIKKKTAASIGRLKEYRSALITSAVTGQIDVTKWTNAGTNDRQLDAIEEEFVA